jgi:hypothetical protein
MRKLLYVCLFICTLPLFAGDGTVKGALTLNGKKFPLTNAYARKREAWPVDAKRLGADNVEDLTCGIIDVLLTNEPLSNKTIASILQDDYKGSETIRGVRFVIDGSGKHKWANVFLLQEGSVTGYGMTQSSGSITTGRHYTGEVHVSNQEVTQTRQFDVEFDVVVSPQFTRTELDNAEAIPADKFAAAYMKSLPGRWEIERWLGLGCLTATGTLDVGEEVSPRKFRGVFKIATSNNDVIEEDVTISMSGKLVHFEGGKVSVPESIWIRDVVDLELWQDLMIGNNASDFLVLRKMRE